MNKYNNLDKLIFDTHAHYDDEAFDTDRKQLLESMKDMGVGYIVNIGASMSTSRNSIDLSKQYDNIYAAVGVHPSEVEELNDNTFLELSSLCNEEKVVAIGEIGLDYHYPEPSKELQKYWFEKQLELAVSKGLQVVIHSRDSAEDTLNILKKYEGLIKGGVIHCFSYSKEMAIEFVKMGYYIGIGGVITFKNAKKLKDAAKEIPIDRIVLETDCPYLAPEPNRGQRNLSSNINYVVKELANIKEISEEDIILKTCENGKKLYKIN